MGTARRLKAKTNPGKEIDPMSRIPFLLLIILCIVGLVGTFKADDNIKWSGLVLTGGDDSCSPEYAPSLTYIVSIEIGRRDDGVVVWRPIVEKKGSDLWQNA